MRNRKLMYETPIATIEKHVGMIILESITEDGPKDEDQGEWDKQSNSTVYF